MTNEKKLQNLGCGFFGERNFPVKPMGENVRLLESRI